MHRVEAPGQQAAEGSPLPPDTRVVVLRHSAERPHTLENAGVSRNEISHEVLNRDTLLRLVEDGKTSRTFDRTAQSGEILYVVARTPSDSLFETYVNTGSGFVPGFDAIQSGRMTMGPVPPKVRRRYRSAFRLQRKEQSASEEASPPDTPSPSDTASTEPDQAAQRAEGRAVSASDSGGESRSSGRWGLLLGGAIGLLVGGGAAWLFFATRIRHVEERRNELRSKLRALKNQQFREATGMAGSGTGGEGKDSPPASPPEDPDRLRTAYHSLQEQNEQLRSRNEALKEEIEQIRHHLETLQNRDD